MNAKNNDPRLYSSDERTLAGLMKKLQELTWPHLKKPTRINYEYFFDDYLVPRFGKSRIDELSTMEFQAFFNSFIGKLSPYTIKNMHAALRTALAQAKTWEIDRNPAIGVKLPKKKAVKPPVLLTSQEIKLIIERLPEPAKTIVILIVFASMRVGEALAVRWNDCPNACTTTTLMIPRRFMGTARFPTTSTESSSQLWHGFGPRRSFVSLRTSFSRQATEPRRNGATSFRHLKAAAKALELEKSIDFRSFRTMHASLMRRTGARAEITRDNMGHSECPTTPEIYSKTWWDERAAAVSAVVDLIMKADEKKDDDNEQQRDEKRRQMLFSAEAISAPSSAPASNLVQSESGLSLDVVERIGRGERI